MNIGEITHALKCIEYYRHGQINSPIKHQQIKQVVLNKDGMVVSVSREVHAGDLFPLVGAICNDKV